MISAGFLRRLALGLLVLFGTACSSGAGGDGGDGTESGESVGSISEATTLSCQTAALPGECRYFVSQAMASSTEGGNECLIPEMAIDGSCTTRWSSNFSDPQWLKLDLGSSRPLSRLIVHWENAASSSYEIQVSDNGNTWTKIATKANATITGSGSTRVDTIAGLTATARYVRLYSLARTTSYGNSIFELEVFGTGCGPAPGCSLIPAFPVAAAASSVQDSDKGPEKAIDSLSSTRWSSLSSDPQWLRLDLGQSTSVARVAIDWEAAASAKYDLQVSDSTSGPWTTINTHTDSRPGPRTDDITGLTGTGRYLRINSTKRLTSYGNSIFEVRVFRQSCDACEQTLAPSSTQASSAESSSYASSKAVDGDLGTRWSSAFSDPQWLSLDFGQDRRVTQVVIKWEGAASKSYRLEGSALANGPWQVIAERTNQPAGPRVDIIKDISAAARYLRVYSTARTSSYGNSIYEIYAYGNANSLACSGDCALGDTDKDNVKDCLDACPRDPTKTAPGICDCGTPDTDSDKDGVPDCKDACPGYPDDQGVGQCGCPDHPTAAGTRCTDGACGVGVCDGAGHCGSPSACPVAPNCTVKQLGASWYWFCPGSFSWQSARSLCAKVQGKLVTADSASENAFVAANMLGTSAWIGANDVSVDGQWRWANITSDGDRIWDGAANGSRYFAAFNNWVAGAPATGTSCAAISSGGRWLSDVCTTPRGFVCEASTDGTETGGDGPNNPPIVPTTGPCTQPADYFKSTTDGHALSQDEINAAMIACDSACSADRNSDACKNACVGPLAIPTGNNCAPFDAELKEACILQSVPANTGPCKLDSDCAGLPGTVCGRYYPNCPPDARNGVASKDTLCRSLNLDPIDNKGSGLVCGVPMPGCARGAADFGQFCDQTEICAEPGRIQGLTNPFADATFKPEAFQPTSYFTEPAKPDPKLPFVSEGKPCGPNGCANLDTNHPWCHLGTDNQLPAAPSVNPNKDGDSGGGLVSFNVDPRLRLSYDANIGPFGLPVPRPNEQHGLNVIADAGFKASVTYKILSNGTIDVLDVAATATAHECGITTDAHFSVFGVDFLPLIAPEVPALPLPGPADTARCEAAFAALQEAGDRAKKALHDAAALLAQYKKMSDVAGDTDNFHPDSCFTLMKNAPRGFPPVDCDAQGVEGAINGFIEYYRRSVLGFAGLDHAGAQLKGVSETVKDFVGNAINYQPSFEIPLYKIPGRDEEVTIASFQFFIGPVPVNLEILSHVKYEGVISLQAAIRPGAVIEQLMFNSGGQDSSRLAYIQATGAPQAGVALSAFAGVGFSVGGLTAKIGIESSLNLASIQVPASAGVGLALGSDPETDRALGVDLAPPISTGKMLLQPKRYVLRFEYGASLGIKLRDMLEGEVKGKLKIKFAFFSKTWSKTLLHFDGICHGEFGDETGKLGGLPCTIPLISLDGSQKLASGTFPWGVVRPTTPFVELQPLTPKAMTPGKFGVDASDAEEFFYDGQCTCITRAQNPVKECFRNDDCCGTDICFPEPASGRNECSGCRILKASCYEDGDCCKGTQCLVDGTNPVRNCRVCQDLGGYCDDNQNCCNGADGTQGTCVAHKCTTVGFCGAACDTTVNHAHIGDDGDCGFGLDRSKLLCDVTTGKCDRQSSAEFACELR